jgi:hypothetical protein
MFFATVPNTVLGLPKGAAYNRRKRGARPPSGKWYPSRVVKRTVQSHWIPTNIIHGPDSSPLYEYTFLAGGRFVSGAETPPSLWSNGVKLGTGYTTGVIPNGATFYDICAKFVVTPVRLTTDPYTSPAVGTGSAVWALGRIHYTDASGKDHAFWAWMLDVIGIHGALYPGGLKL